MKKLALIVALLFVTAQAFCVSSLVQNNLGGHATVSGGGGLTTATTTGSFASTTGTGDLLVLIAWCTGTQISNSTTTISATAPGFTWLSGVQVPGGIISGTTILTAAIVYINNAASMASSVINTVSCANDFAPSVTVEFALLEFNGLIASPFTGQNGTGAFQSGGTPGVLVSNGILGPPGTTNLVVMGLSAVGSNIGAGSGFTLGPTATTATVGQIQFQSGYPRTSATLSYGGTETTWVASAIAFTEASASPSVVRRHRGFVN